MPPPPAAGDAAAHPTSTGRQFPAQPTTERRARRVTIADDIYIVLYIYITRATEVGPDRQGSEGNCPECACRLILIYMNSVAGELQRFKAEFFRALAHPIRIEILEVLLQGERSVHELQEILNVDQPVVSQQLAVLRAKHIVAGRKEGTSVRYVVCDPLIGELLGVARRIFNNHLVGTQGLLRELKRQERRR